MTQWKGSVRTQHIGGEALLVDLGRSIILSDHPHRFGGSDKGPMPGDFMKGALASSAALALGAAADRGDLPISSIAIRCTSSLGYKDVDGPIKTLIYVPNFILDIALTGNLDDQQLAAAREMVLGTRVALALAGNIELDETNAFISGDSARTPVGGMSLLTETRGVIDPDRMRDQQSPVVAFVEYVGGGRALINWGHSSCVVSADDTGVAGCVGDPESLLLASLAACTTVYTSRAAARTGASVDLTVFVEGWFTGDGDAPGGITKRLEIGGNVTPEQREDIAFSSDNCALGNTLRLRSEIEINMHCVAGENGRSGVPGSAQEALAKVAVVECDDGACCVAQDGR